MSRLMHLATAGLLLSAVPTFAQTAATVDPEVQSFACELTGDCGAAATDEASAAAPAAPRGARTSSTRGFTFKRSVAPGEQLAAKPATNPVAAPARPAPQRPTSFGSADLKLDFAPGSAVLAPAARARLAKLATVLSSERLANKRMRIEGHTDSAGSAATNKALSQRRAQAAADVLIASGVPSQRLEVVGYGSAKPLPGHAATDGANRRVVATLLN